MNVLYGYTILWFDYSFFIWEISELFPVLENYKQSYYKYLQTGFLYEHEFSLNMGNYLGVELQISLFIFMAQVLFKLELMHIKCLTVYYK